MRALITVIAVMTALLALSTLYAQLRPRWSLPGHGDADRVVRVQVLNGTSEAGLGLRAAAHLRAGGFHVVEVRNADRSDYFASLVVARRDDPESARRVARYLGGPALIRQAWTSDLAEVTLVLGRDRSGLRLGE